MYDEMTPWIYAQTYNKNGCFFNLSSNVLQNITGCVLTLIYDEITGCIYIVMHQDMICYIYTVMYR